jgi:hypothetical protein
MDLAIMRLTRQMVAARNSAEARVMERQPLCVRTRAGGSRRQRKLGGDFSPLGKRRSKGHVEGIRCGSLSREAGCTRQRCLDRG